ncbi:L-cysteine desulfidase [Desulfobaculum xiamenense]|uniref:UPF0597 protein GGQ74_002540 n=1 Tax=Desulfobaculum xiamenense TaxID=995050 RepID=A0A846QNV6_9BACT|nr:L-serine ammonia-lyase, iron-sulfur-dependent, subunit alpha [Desulfobaculum xiamenense]NJB68867.1 L-cysteine desulfidase [Desulfobaculum xiamenense]
MTFSIKDILLMEVAPALGCTEPVAIALAAAAAASLLDHPEPDAIEVWVDPNIYKNGLAVIIPGTGGLVGLDTAAALGAFGGDASRGLEVLDTVDDAAVDRTRACVRDARVLVNLLEDRKGLFIRVLIRSGADTAEAVIEGVHDNITTLLRNGQPVADSPLVASKRGVDKGGLCALEEWLKAQSLDRLLELLDGLDADDLVFLREGVDTNMRLAEYGLRNDPGLGVGRTLERLVRQKLICRDMVQAARILTSAAADARMGGARLPAMSSAGSGNHGLTAILPIRAVYDYVACTEEDMLRAVALSHVVTAYVKAYTGRLSAVCGCSVAAGAGATAGVALLLGGSARHVAGAIKNLTGDLAGVICDGAKAGCALKLATAAGTAVQAALFALQGVNVWETDGIIGPSPEKTMQNIGTLSTEGMIETDRTILKIMLEKRFSGY